jgi:hypothetical protein
MAKELTKIQKMIDEIRGQKVMLDPSVRFYVPINRR